MDKLLKQRIAAKGWVTRAAEEVEKAVANSKEAAEVSVLLEDLERRMLKLETVQEEVEVKIEDEHELEHDIAVAHAFRKVALHTKFIGTDYVSHSHTGQAHGSSSASISSSSVKAKLPKLTLPTFSGDVLQFSSFWEQFNSLVDSTDMMDVSKFSYLRSCLKNEAKAVIDGLSLTAANYQIARDHLISQRFGRKDRIVFAHIQSLLSLSSPGLGLRSGQKYISSLWKLQDEISTHVRSLEALGVSGEQFGLFLTPTILSRLPNDIRLEWSREGSGHEADLVYLMDFLRKEIERRERSESFRDISQSVKQEQEKKTPSTGTASVLMASHDLSCVFCTGDYARSHSSENCWNIHKLTLPEREARIRNMKLCFKCLGKGHFARRCKSSCTKCKGKHNSLLCGYKPIDSAQVQGSNVSSSNLSSSGASSQGSHSISNSVPNQNFSSETNHQGSLLIDSPVQCVLQTARVNVVTSDNTVLEATVLFDAGADRTFVSSQFVERVKPKCIKYENVNYTSFGEERSKTLSKSKVFELNLLDDTGLNHFVSVIESQNICGPLMRPGLPSQIIDKFSDVKLADNYQSDRQLTVDILIGLDVYWRFVKPEKLCRVGSIVGQESVFGWLLSGSWSVPTNSKFEVSQMLCINETSVSESLINKFWDLESVGIIDSPSKSDSVIESFSKTIEYQDGRYEVALPWKSDQVKQNVLDNRKLAQKRLSSLQRKLDRDDTLKNNYNSVFIEYEKQEIIEEVPISEIASAGGHPIYYLPHHPVIRESSLSTKVRPVFDCSAKGQNGVSLNDCMEAGPSLIPDLVEVLIRFRRWPVALTADITKAFLQILVKPEDRDVHRFLWNNDGSQRIMRFARVPFGNKSSPFLLNATIKYHLSVSPPSRVVTEMSNNLYVDDWLSGADSLQEANEMFHEAKNVMSLAGMNLAKWNSNSKIISEQNHLDFIDSESMKVLGVQWNSSDDYFSYSGITYDLNYEVASSKRLVLSHLARLFDPLGFLSPFVMTIKILFQDIWRLGLDWDSKLPNDLHERFFKWLKGLESIKLLEIPRCYSALPWFSYMNHFELHGFGDASEKGYGACIYMRIPDQKGSYSVSLVISKARIAPMKRVSMPRLELLAALLCARLLNFVKNSLHVETEISSYCYTDSQVVLAWIKSDPSRWKMFVANRITEIHSLTSPDSWNYCPGLENPADLLTRGFNATQLIKSRMWFNGPSWLSQSGTLQSDSDESPSVIDMSDYQNEVTVSCVAINSPVFDLQRWSSLSKAIRIVALVFRFINNIRYKSGKVVGELSDVDLDKAKVYLLRSEQQVAFSSEISALKQGKSLSKGSPIKNLDPFIAEDGLLRIKGRLEFSDLEYESKHPIIVPKGYFARLLVRFQHTIMKHAGISTLISTIRQNYWVIGLRNLAKSVCIECIPCRRQHSKSCSQTVAPLPDLRVKASPPFNVTGLDFAGPLFCADLPSKKLYVLLFTCAVVRSVHLELTDSLNVIDCMLAIRRFVARRGIPNIFYSDNAKTFTCAAQKVKLYFGHLSPKWKFIAPRSPWWGGWWERLVRSVKYALKKTLGIRCLSRVELETTLHEVEACINSRPLTFVGDDPDWSNPLTPTNFLIGRNSVYQKCFESPTVVELPDVTQRELNEKVSLRQDKLDKFWQSWSDNYIKNLPPVVKGFISRCNIHEGSIVLIREDNTVRLKWPLGIITKLYPGLDGIVRSVDIRTSKGVIKRSVQRLHDLEISNPVDLGSVEKSVGKSQVTRSGRVVKVPQRFEA